ncbi:recombination mediator RecR [Terrabacter sp. 2YAF2]
MYEGAVQDLIDELGRLPGVGPKSAQRIAFHLLQADSDDVTRLVTALTEVKARVRFCEECGNVAEAEKCRICADPRRDHTAICVVEEPKDVVAIERTREFRGKYHVLGGAISPIDGIGPDDLRVRELMTRLASGEVQEVIIATDPNLEGEATATYLSRLLRDVGLTVTVSGRIALSIEADGLLFRSEGADCSFDRRGRIALSIGGGGLLFRLEKGGGSMRHQRWCARSRGDRATRHTACWDHD